MTLNQIHSALGNSVIMFLFVCGVWGIGLFVLRRPVNGSYLGSLVIGELLVLGQAVTGVFMLFAGSMPNNNIHFLYGLLVVISLPVLYAYVSSRSSRFDPLIYGVASLLIMGFAMRAQTTAFAV